MSYRQVGEEKEEKNEFREEIYRKTMYVKKSNEKGKKQKYLTQKKFKK